MVHYEHMNDLRRNTTLIMTETTVTSSSLFQRQARQEKMDEQTTSRLTGPVNRSIVDFLTGAQRQELEACVNNVCNKLRSNKNDPNEPMEMMLGLHGKISFTMEGMDLFQSPSNDLDSVIEEVQKICKGRPSVAIDYARLMVNHIIRENITSATYHSILKALDMLRSFDIYLLYVGLVHNFRTKMTFTKKAYDNAMATNQDPVHMKDSTLQAMTHSIPTKYPNAELRGVFMSPVRKLQAMKRELEPRRTQFKPTDAKAQVRQVSALQYSTAVLSPMQWVTLSSNGHEAQNERHPDPDTPRLEPFDDETLIQFLKKPRAYSKGTQYLVKWQRDLAGYDWKYLDNDAMQYVRLLWWLDMIPRYLYCNLTQHGIATKSMAETIDYMKPAWE